MKYVIQDDCIACGSCADTCPMDAIEEGDMYRINLSLCVACGACADSCPVDAIVREGEGKPEPVKKRSFLRKLFTK